MSKAKINEDEFIPEKGDPKYVEAKTVFIEPKGNEPMAGEVRSDNTRTVDNPRGGDSRYADAKTGPRADEVIGSESKSNIRIDPKDPKDTYTTREDGGLYGGDADATPQVDLRPQSQQSEFGPERVNAAALRAYLAWGAHHNYREPRTNTGLQPWDNLTKAEQDAWRNAAFAVLTGG